MSDVRQAARLLIEEMRSAQDEVRAQAHRAVDAGKVDQVRRLLERVEAQQALIIELEALIKRWRRENRVSRSSSSERSDFGKLPPGVKTPEAHFRQPILEALVEFGGGAPVSDVLDRVEMKMKERLLPVDYELLPSRGAPRWRNSAHWIRAEMVDEGLISGDSPRGVWEITSDGRDWLQAQ